MGNKLGRVGGADGRRTRGWRAGLARLALGAVVASTTLTAASGTAEAQQPTTAQRDEAKRRFQSGLELFKEGNYQASLVEFKRAYEIAPNYNVLYNIGQVYFQLQDYVNASKYLNQYLDEGKARITPTRRGEVEADLEKLRARIAQVTISVNVSGAQITVDDAPLGVSPLGQPSLVSAGRRVFTAAKEGRQTARKTVEVAGGDRLEVQLELTELAPGQAPTALPPVQPDGSQPEPQPHADGQEPQPVAEKPFPVAPVVAWSVTGVLGIGAAVFGVMALGKDDDLTVLKSTPNPNEEELASASSSTTTLAAVSDVFLVCTVIGAGVSIYLTVDHVTSDPPEADASRRPMPPSPTVAAKVGPGSLGLAGTF